VITNLSDYLGPNLLYLKPTIPVSETSLIIPKVSEIEKKNETARGCDKRWVIFAVVAGVVGVLIMFLALWFS
jgi:hypothetical protein